MKKIDGFNMAKIFNENLGKASNRKELAILKKKFSHYDSLYVAISTMIRPDFRDWLEVLWKQYEPYADTNFSSELKKQFNQRVWEMYLGSTLLNRGYILGDHTNIGPDFRIPQNNKQVWIEAIAIEKGMGKDRVPDIVYGKMIDVPEKEMLLRLTSAIKEKHGKYLSYINDSHIGKNEPFIIAIDRSPLEHSDPQIPLIFKCLFGIGHQVLFIRKLGSKAKTKTERSNWSSRDKVYKINGSEVGMFVFGDNNFEGISAIIYNDQNILNCYREPNQMGNNFIVVHNPFAKNPLSPNFFNFGEEWKQEGDLLKKLSKKNKQL